MWGHSESMQLRQVFGLFDFGTSQQYPIEPLTRIQCR